MPTGNSNGAPIEPAKALQLPRVWTASELVKTDWPDPRWAVPGIIPQGLTLLVGAPKIGKSWLCLSLGIAVSRGGYVFGQIAVAQGSVLYLALEDRPARLAKRLEILGFQPQEDDPFHLATDWKRMGEGALKLIARWLTDHPDCRLVIIDTLAKIRKLNDNPRSVYQEEYQLGDELKKLADAYSVAVLVLHHIRKMKADDPLESVSGTFGLTGVVDSTLIIQRARGQADATLFLTGRDIPEERHIAMRFDSTSAQWAIIGDATAYAVSKERQAILKLLADGQVLTPREMAQVLGKPVGAIKKLAWTMYQEGQIRNVGEGRYARLDRSESASNGNRGNRVTAVTAGTGPDWSESASNGNRGNRVTAVTTHTVGHFTGDSNAQTPPSGPVTAVTAVTRGSAVTAVTQYCSRCGRSLPNGRDELCGNCEVDLIASDALFVEPEEEPWE